MYIKKHGNPGIGITGKKGIDGIDGPGIYFKKLDEYFTYIGDTSLYDMNKDYDDINYDITYAENEVRLDPIYKTGDILYVISDDNINKNILYFVEITDDLTTCTKEYFLQNIKYKLPFTVKNGESHKNNRDEELYKTTNYNINLASVNDKLKSKLYNLNSIYSDAVIVGSSIGNDTETISSIPVNIDDISIDYSNTYSDIPFIYNKNNNIKKLDIVNNGKDVLEYTNTPGTTKIGLISLKADSNSLSNSLDISANQESCIKISAGNASIYIDNLCITNNNLGNLEAYYSLYNSELLLDDNGNCYTLTLYDYDSSTLTFTMNPDFFFADSCINNHSDYHYGYIHMFWNYDNNSAYLGSTNTYFYLPNYITAHEIEDIQKPVTVIKKDEEGIYVRNWDSSEFKAITSEPIKDLLINTTDQQTLKDVSNQLSDKANLEDIYKYLDVRGIIVTEQVYKNLEYDILRSLDGTRIYKNYEDETLSDEIRYNDLISHNINDVKLILDTSFNSSIIYKTDPDDLKINLNIKDKFATPYRNHYILQWISTPNGLKYYSKPTKAVYNQQYNSYNIISSWNPVIYQKPGYIDTSTLGNEKLFDIIVLGNNVIIDASTQGEQEKVTKIELYQNSESKGQKTVGSDGLCRYNGIFPTITDSTSSSINNTNILNDLYNLSFSSEGEQYILYTIKYSIGEETELTHISTFKYMLLKYDEVRSLPKISLKCYNDLESLEQLNKAENGILCNQFQFFVDLKIDDFNENNWGKITHLLNNPTLKLTLNIDASTCEITNNTNNTNNTNYTFINNLLNNNKVRTSVSLLKPNVDIFNITARDLENTNNLYGDIITTNSYNCEFNLDDANKGIYKLRVLIETTNPEPILMKYHVYVSSLSIKAGNNTYNLNPTYLINTNNNEKPYLYDSETLKMVIAPISMIMSYKQNLDDISDIGKYKWFGSEEEINISLKPYKYEWVTDISFDRTKDLRWNSYKIKRRYFQDNIRYIEVDPININYIKDLLPNRLYHNSYLAKDKDDIFDTYLEIIYNGNLFNPFLETDLEIILYNNIGYLLSKYDQYRNNTAVFIKQDFKYEVRTENLLNSMLKWNEEYVKHKYKSDNPYQGHLSTYGNGYQYLDKTIDTGQFIINNYMLLEDVKNINSQYIFEKNTYLTNNINKPDKSDQYTPDKFFRTLLYQAKWCYPYYTTDNGLNLINQIPLTDNVITNNIKPTEMPYNLTYKIYPRVLFNDEEQVNIILMLRRPSIITDGEPSGDSYTDPLYELTKEDLKYKETNIIQELTDPINVMN